MGLASLGGVPFRIDPAAVSWQFAMKTARRKTVGGMVVQVYGTDLGDMTVSGVFGFGDRSRGDTAGWEDQERFRAQVESWVDQAISTAGARPLRFLYAPKKWDFQVLVKAYSGPGSGGDAVVHEPGVFNPGWTLTLFIVQDSTRRVVAGIRDLYISRLMSGIGWKQSQYNGPLSQQEVEETLAPYGGNLKSYLTDQFNQAAGTPRGEPLQPADGGSGGGGAAAGSSVDGWITQAGQAMGRTFTAGQREAIKIVAKHESSNNPKAENLSAAGARAGYPKGLMQTVIATFNANKLSGYGDIFDPVHNIIAAVRYAEGRYGDIERIPGVVSVRAGRGYVPY